MKSAWFWQFIWYKYLNRISIILKKPWIGQEVYQVASKEKLF